MRTHAARHAKLVSAVLVALIWSGIGPPAGGEDGLALPRHDRGVLSEIADDVLRRGAAGAKVSMPEEVWPGAEASKAEIAGESAPDPVPPVAHIAPAQEGIIVAIPPGSAPAQTVVHDAAATGHQSNSWRRRPGTARGLSFSSGVLAPASGLDPALSAHADGLMARGRPFVYGFLLLRIPLDESLEKTLAGLGVELLGPHDDHHKARLPVGALQAIADLPEVEWIGVSAREQKRSRELSELRRGRARAAGIDAATPIPIVINLFEGDASGDFRRELEAAGAAVGEYDADLHFYRAVATAPAIDRIAGLDFVLFIEPITLGANTHDQSTALVDADMIRPGTPLGLTRFSGASVFVGIMDGGFMMGPTAPVMHRDLDKAACGQNFTNEAGSAFNDLRGHGTHVIATIAGTGTVEPRFRGVAPGVGSVYQIRAAKITDKTGYGDTSWAESAMDFMSSFGVCAHAPPEVINVSYGVPGTGYTGTDKLSRKLDDKVWTYGQTYVVGAGNEGPGQTIRQPGVAKNALTVGSVFGTQYLRVGDIANSSSRGPTGDGRMKPNLVAPGNLVTSAKAGSTSSFEPLSGTSMAAPHVTGLAATLMEHYSEFRGRPAFLRSHLMATAIAHDDVTGKRNDYGLGRVSGYLAHWAHPNSAGWSTHWFYGGVNGGSGYPYGDVTVPPNTRRLVVVLTWDEPAGSAGASRAVTYDLNLWADHNADCIDPSGACGEYFSVSDVDNVEYVVVENPPAGTYRLKVHPLSAPVFPLRYGMTAVVIRGDTTPAMTMFLTPPSSPPLVGSLFEVKASVGTPAYVASGVQIQPTVLPSGLTLTAVQTMRHDGVPMAFHHEPDTLTLGNLVPTHSRPASYWFRADTAGTKTFSVRAWSENGGEVIASTSFQVQPLSVDLVQSAMGTSPGTPIAAPGTTFSVTDTVQNLGPGASTSSRTRYYLSLDAVKGAGDTLLTGTHSVPGLAAGASHTATVKVTVPAGITLDTYFLLACADDLDGVGEADEGNNCAVSPGATVTVTRPDLVVNAISAPPATVKRGGKFPVTDTTHNLGAVASESSKTRYYLSLDGVKTTGDKLLGGTRSVAALAPGASRSGTVTVTVPTATALETYFVLACADDLGQRAELDETNNCKPSGTTVTITP